MTRIYARSTPLPWRCVCIIMLRNFKKEEKNIHTGRVETREMRTMPA